MMYKVADIIFDPFGQEVLQSLQHYLSHPDKFLKFEAKKAHKEWRGI